jgi:hypothetical protein
VVRGLLDFPLQDKKIRAKALFFLYRGSWPDSTTDDIEKGVQTGTGFPSSGLTKKQNNESAAEMSVFVIAFGTFESNEAVGEHVDSIEIASATRATKADTTAAPSREKIL